MDCSLAPGCSKVLADKRADYKMVQDYNIPGYYKKVHKMVPDYSWARTLVDIHNLFKERTK